MFNINFNPKYLKVLKKYPKEVSKRILKKIRILREKPVPPDAKRIVDVKGKMFRIRIGDYRVLYVINYTKREIYIAKIEKRERAY